MSALSFPSVTMKDEDWGHIEQQKHHTSSLQRRAHVPPHQLHSGMFSHLQTVRTRQARLVASGCFLIEPSSFSEDLLITLCFTLLLLLPCV